MNILVVDDEKEIADIIAVYLENEKYDVFKCNSGKEAIDCIDNNVIDLAILDVMLPDMNGFDILKRIRGEYTFPVLMLTAKTDYADKINGLTLGADDYIPKPFNPLELVARVKAQLRRSTQYNLGPDEENLEYAGLIVDKDKSVCVYENKEISLTPTELDILQILIEKKGNVASTDEILSKIRGSENKDTKTNAVMVHIRHLREKINESTGRDDFIKTVWGVGYRING